MANAVPANEPNLLPLSRQNSIPAIEILWLTAGLGCDGDTIAMTAATNPSIEDLVLGAIPGIPKVRFHNPVLAYDVGKDFVRTFEKAALGELDPFILVVEGSIPNEKNKDEGCWAGFGMDQAGQPIPTCEWIDRRPGAGPRRPEHSAWRHSRGRAIHDCMGAPDYLVAMKSGRHPIVCVPG